jgi:hypothetical protein
MCSRTALAFYCLHLGMQTARLLSLREACSSRISLNFTRANNKVMMRLDYHRCVSLPCSSDGRTLSLDIAGEANLDTEPQSYQLMVIWDCSRMLREELPTMIW